MRSTYHWTVKVVKGGPSRILSSQCLARLHVCNLLMVPPNLNSDETDICAYDDPTSVKNRVKDLLYLQILTL
jgi:hypothetical protein